MKTGIILFLLITNFLTFSSFSYFVSKIVNQDVIVTNDGIYKCKIQTGGVK